MAFAGRKLQRVGAFFGHLDSNVLGTTEENVVEDFLEIITNESTRHEYSPYPINEVTLTVSCQIPNRNRRRALGG